MPWIQLIGAFVGQAAKPVNVSTPDASLYQLKSSPVTAIAIVAGVGAIGFLAWYAIKK